ncbi:hypothetical protein Hanom_Chr03g00192341 [Helianthus anomalus]
MMISWWFRSFILQDLLLMRIRNRFFFNPFRRFLGCFADIFFCFNDFRSFLRCFTNSLFC